MKIRDIMTKEVGICGPHTNAAAIAEIMWSNDCGAVPVVDERGTVLGIVTDRDLTIALGTRNRRASSLRADEVMTKDPACCRPDDDVRRALEVMESLRIRRLPIADANGKLEGMLSASDILRAASKPRADVPMALVMRAMARLNDRTAPREAPTLAGAAS